MKHLLFKMVIAGTLIISALNSCKKDEYIPIPGPSDGMPVILNLTASHWEPQSGEIFISTFKNVIPGNGHSVQVYVVENGKETLLDRPIRFANGALWATSTQTDIKIWYRGTPESAFYVNIKLVME